jgi:hypothetical protein
MIPLALLALIAVSYGALATKLGFYWDDWTIVWYIHFLGPESFKAAFASDRPLLALVYNLTTPLMGESPLNWQVLAIFSRWLACSALWWALHGLWPRKNLQTAAAAILFALYPGFKQGFIAITYGNAFIVLAVYLASWGALIWALRRPRWFWALFLTSLVLAGYSVFTAEHFFGLELLRPVFLWIVLNDRKEVSIRDPKGFLKTLRVWAPYLLIDLLFLAWRISTPTPRAQITLLEDLRTNPFSAALTLAGTIAKDIYTSSALAWGQILQFSWLSAHPQAILVRYVAIVLAAGGLVGLTLLFLRQGRHTGSPLQFGEYTGTPPEPDGHAGPSLRDGGYERRWAVQAIGLGLFAMLVAGIPIWPTNLRIELAFPWDRFTLPMMFGAALILVGLIELLNFVPYQNVALIAITAGLAAGMHYHNALNFRLDWLAQRDYFWQLTWRAPAIKPGTILLTSEMPFSYEWDNSLTAPLNWTYAPELEGNALPYLMYNAESRLSSGLPDLEETTRANEYFRIAPFNGSFSQTVLAFYRPPGSCVKVIDPQNDQYLPDKPRYFREIYTLSDPDLILSDADPAALPPLQFFGPPPEPDWCYYFEKAELARQNEDWEQIASLGEAAFREQKAFFRKNAFELLPFIEAYARLGNWEQAYELTIQAYDAWENMHLGLCDIWESVLTDGSLSEQGQATYEKVRETLPCPTPTP